MNNTNDKSGWISAKDKLPSKKKDADFYLVYKKFKIKGRLKPHYAMSVDLFENGKFESNYVTHWQPLPQPPQTKNS